MSLLRRKLVSYARVLRKLTVCRHWTLDRLPAEALRQASVGVSLAMALVGVGCAFV